MATKNIVPRADNEGGIGRADKRWHSGSFVSGSFGSIESTQFSGSGINITGIITSSYSISSSHAITSSYALSSGGVGGLWTASSGQITRDSDVSITGSLYMKGDILPDTRFVYDLGSLGKSWRNLFVQHHSIQFVSESNSIASIGATSDGTVTTSGSAFECEGLFNSGSIISTGSINNDGGLTATTISCSGMFCSGDMTGMSQVTSDTGSFSVIEGNSPLTISSSLLTIKGGVQNLSCCHVSHCITASIFSGSHEGTLESTGITNTGALIQSGTAAFNASTTFNQGAAFDDGEFTMGTDGRISYGDWIQSVAETSIDCRFKNIIELREARVPAPWTVTSIHHATEGQQLILLADPTMGVAVTIQDNANMNLNGTADFVMSSGDTLTLVASSTMGTWHETSRMVR